MTEAEWLACDDIARLSDGRGAWRAGAVTEWLARPARKRLLFALACVDTIRPDLHDRRLLAAVELMDRCAEDGYDFDRLRAAAAEVSAAHQAIWDDPSEQRWFYIHEGAAEAALFAVHPELLEFPEALVGRCVNVLSLRARANPESLFADRFRWRFACLYREVFGNPFRPVSADPRWLTADVLALAKGIYAERAFDRMPILADALQDAGCESDEVLTHCRGPGEHVRGCWVLDLLLGKG